MATCSSKFLEEIPQPEGFYGIVVKQTDDAASFAGIRIVSFEADSFYITQNDPNIDEAIVNFRGTAGGGGAGEANTGSNLGAGEGVFAQKSGVDLQFKSLVAGPNVTLSSDSNEITITSSTEFYGITVAETDDDPSFSGIRKINFKAEDFYVTQAFDNTDEVQIQARPFARPFINFSFEEVSRIIEVPIEQQMVVHDGIEVIDPDGELRVEGTVVLEI